MNILRVGRIRLRVNVKLDRPKNIFRSSAWNWRMERTPDRSKNIFSAWQKAAGMR